MQDRLERGADGRGAEDPSATGTSGPAVIDVERSRRALLGRTAKALLAGAGAALGAGRAEARAQVPTTVASAGPPRELATPTPDDPAVLRALVERLGFGFDLALYDRARAIGYHALLEEQLHPGTIPDPYGDALEASVPLLGMSSKELQTNYGLFSDVPITTLKAATVQRAVGSSRRLFERLVGLWSDHFNIFAGNALVRIYKVGDDREVVRAHVLGRFGHMLRASAESAAMLEYLDNVSNTALGPQENYARELLELHTLGVDGGYTEQDVKEVARCFTGWTVYGPLGPQFGEFVFRSFQHDQGSKTVLGVSIPAFGGKSDGDTVLSTLIEHPSTPVFLAEKLVSRLVAYAPPAACVRRVARIYRETDGDLRAMTRAALAFETLVETRAWIERKFKRPFHFATGLLRQLGAEISDGPLLVERLSGLGQAPFEWGPPNGYPDSLGAWGSNLLPRWRFAADLMADNGVGASVPTGPLLAKLGFPTKGEFVAALDRHLTGGRMDAEDRQLVQGYLDELPALDAAAIRDAVGLAASSPSYQLY